MNEVDNQILNLEKFCDAQISKFNYTNFDKSIYHYTTLKNFTNIIKGQTFYFTHYKNLNDTHELKHGLKIIHNVISKSRLPESDFLLAVINKTLSDINYYISSFSKRPDNLSLWRLYADDGYGIVLGVSPNFSLEINNPVENPHIALALYDESMLENIYCKVMWKSIKCY